MFKYELGQKLKCKVTGFTGVVMGRLQYFNGCIQYDLRRPVDPKTGEHRDGRWIDEEQLNPVKSSKRIMPPKAARVPGGPSRGPADQQP